MATTDTQHGTARYVFRVRFRIEPVAPAVSVEPAEFETAYYRTAAPPGTDGWLFFREYLWRGDVGDEAYFCEIAEEALDVPVVSVSFSELQTAQAYLDALRDAIGADLELFKAETVDEALTKYLGSSIRVVSGDDQWNR